MNEKKSIIWITQILRDLDCLQKNSIKVYEDNQGAVAWSNEGIRQSKHVDIRQNFVKKKKKMNEDIIRITYSRRNEMTSEILTKLLPRLLFKKHCVGL